MIESRYKRAREGDLSLPIARTTSTSAPAALLLALARGDKAGTAQVLQSVVKEKSVFRLAKHHEVDPLCAWMIRNCLAPEVQSPTLRSLDRVLWPRYVHHLLRNESLVRDIEHLQRELHRSGVEALFLKGPSLLVKAYPNPGTRPVGDIDLCIREQDVFAATGALERAGYTPQTPVPASVEECVRRAHFSRQLIFLARGRRAVELHFRLINMGPPGVNEDWVRETARDLSVGSTRIQVPGREAMLLHLLVHANQHGFSVLRLLHDIRWFLATEQGSWRWNLLTDRIRELHGGPSAYFALSLAMELAGAEVDKSLLEQLKPTRVRRLLFDKLWRLPAVRSLQRRRMPRELEAPLYYLLEMGSLTSKARYVAGIIGETGVTGLLARYRTLVTRDNR